MSGGLRPSHRTRGPTPGPGLDHVCVVPACREIFLPRSFGGVWFPWVCGTLGDGPTNRAQDRQREVSRTCFPPRGNHTYARRIPEACCIIAGRPDARLSFHLPGSHKSRRKTRGWLQPAAHLAQCPGPLSASPRGGPWGILPRPTSALSARHSVTSRPSKSLINREVPRA